MPTPLRETLEKAVPDGERLLLDTTALISYLEGGGDRWSEAARVVVEDFVRPGRNPAVVSVVSVMESLIRPMRRVPPSEQTVLEFFAHWTNLAVIPIDLMIAREAASIRAHHNLTAPDALIIGTGLVAGASHLVTCDQALQRSLDQVESGIRVCYLGDYA